MILTSSLALVLSTLPPSAAPVAPLGDGGAEPHRKTTAVVPSHLMPRAVTSFGAASLGGYVYTLGGWYGTPHDYHREAQSSSFARLNPLDGSWQELPSPGPLQSVALVAHEDALYRVGGMRARNAPGDEQDLVSSPAFARFDALSETWRDLAPLPAPRSSHMAAVRGDQLWVVGGWNIGLADEDERWHTEALAFDLSDPTASWRPVPAPFRRRALGVATVADVVVAIGGIDPDGELSSRMDVLRTTDATWSRGPDYPETGFGLSAVGHEGRIWASAGDGAVHSWAPGEDAWRLETSWVFPRFFHQLVGARPGEVWALGGVARGGRIRHVERLLLGEAPDVRTTHWSLPRRGRAIAEQGAFRARNSLFAFGGVDSTGEPVDEVVRLDLAQLTFETRSPLPTPLVRARVANGPRTTDVVALASGRSGEDAALEPAAFEFEPKYDLWSRREGAQRAPATAVPLRWGDRTLTFGTDAADGDPAHVALPRFRRDFAVARIGAEAYVVGGVDADGEALVECDVYALDAGTWTAGPELARPRIAPVVATLGRTLYVAGGRTDGGHVATSLDALDTASGRWSTPVAELPIAAATIELFAFGDRLLVYAPEHDGDYVDVVLVDPGRARLERRDVGGHFGG